MKMLYNLLNALDTYLFVSDMETDEVLFINDKMKERFNLDDKAVGQLCYRVINPCMEERCEFCVKKKLLEQPDEELELETQVYLRERYYKKIDRIIEWVGGQKAHLQYFIDITDLMTVETVKKERLKSEKQLKLMSAVVNSSQHYISYIDGKGNFDFLNPAASRISGYSHDEMMHGGVSLLFGEETSRHIYDEIIPALKENGHLSFELPLIRADGEIRTMLFSSFIIETDEDGFGAIARDITEEKQKETQLQLAYALINSAPQYISYIDLDGNYEFFNPATCEITGYSRDELMAGGVTMLYSDKTNRRIADDILPAITAKGRYAFELPLIRKDGKVRIMDFSAFEVASHESKHGCIATDITEQKRLERVSIETKEKLERLINTAPVAYGLSIDGVVLECNEYAEKHLGMKPGDSTLSFYVCPEEREALFTQGKANDTAIAGIVRLHLADGGSHRFFVNYGSLKHDGRDAYILWAVDIEDSELHKDQIRQTQQSLQTVLDFLPVPITIIDVEEGHLIYANNYAAELFGVPSPEAAYGCYVGDFFPLTQPDGTNSVEKSTALDFEEPHSIELVCAKSNGETFEALITGCVIEYKGRKASLSIIQDLTTEKEYQKMLQDTAEKAKEANQAKSEFLSRMSHEIRTPLNAITGMTTIAKTAHEPEKISNCIGKIDTASKHLLGLINDILDMAKIESGKMELSYDTIDIVNMIGNISDIIRFRTESKGQTLIVKLGEDIPPYIIGDELRLSQVITNLLSNAHKFTPENGKIVLTVYKQEEQDGIYTLRFTVEDNGIGISKEQHSQIFDAFEQASGSISRIYGGTGLGLSITKQLVELMGGEIWLESELGRGSKFNFIITAQNCTAPSRDKQWRGVPITSGDFKRFTILLAEDVDINREIIAALLEDTGVTIAFAENGSEAVKLFQNDPGLYSLILMDIHMPKMDGYEATRRIRSLDCDEAKHVPIIAMTADVFKEDIERCLAAGMNNHIGKPVDAEELLSKLNKFLLAKN